MTEYKSSEFAMMFKQKSIIIPEEDTQSKTLNQNNFNKINLDNTNAALNKNYYEYLKNIESVRDRKS